MKNAEKASEAAQSQVYARYKPGTSHVIGRGLGGASQVHARYMGGTCDIQARYKPSAGHEHGSCARILRLRARAGFASIPGGTWLKLDRWLDRPNARW